MIEDLKFMWNEADVYNKIYMVLIPLIIITGIFTLGLFFGMSFNGEDIDAKNNEIMQIRKEINKLSDRVSVLENENESLKEENRLLRAQNEMLTVRIEKLTDELNNDNSDVAKNINRDNNIDYGEFDYAINPNDYDDTVYYGNSLTKNDINLIYKYSREDGELIVNPHLVVSLLFRESSFRENVSNGDCHGLGQVRLSTAEYVEEKFGYNDSVNKEKLYDREINIKYVVSYLKYLYSRYGDDKTVLKRYSGSSSDKVLKRYLEGMNAFSKDTRGVDIYEFLDFRL